MQKSERAMEQRSIVYETSGTVYHQSFAIIGFFGLALLVLGTIMLLKDQTIVGATFLGIGAIFIIRGIGLARAGKKYRALAAEERSETANK
jgi:membrane-bound ClpP family serine protease